MRLKICYNASTKEVEILEHDPGEVLVKIEKVEGDDITFIVSTTEEQYGSVHEHTIGKF